jgi:hypothetical protein
MNREQSTVEYKERINKTHKPNICKCCDNYEWILNYKINELKSQVLQIGREMRQELPEKCICRELCQFHGSNRYNRAIDDLITKIKEL